MSDIVDRLRVFLEGALGDDDDLPEHQLLRACLAEIETLRAELAAKHKAMIENTNAFRLENGEKDAAIKALAVALQRHRIDMHNTSNRPCDTCAESKKALASVGVTAYVYDPRAGRKVYDEAIEDAQTARAYVPKVSP